MKKECGPPHTPFHAVIPSDSEGSQTRQVPRHGVEVRDSSACWPRNDGPRPVVPSDSEGSRTRQSPRHGVEVWESSASSSAWELRREPNWPRRPASRSTTASWSTRTCKPALPASMPRATWLVSPSEFPASVGGAARPGCRAHDSRHRRPVSGRPLLRSQHYDVTISYVGHASSWDSLELRGDLSARDAAAIYFDRAECWLLRRSAAMASAWPWKRRWSGVTRMPWKR